MRNMQLKPMFMIFLTIGATLFNLALDSTTIFGFFMLFVTLIFIMLWINYIVHSLTSTNTKKVNIVISEIYFSVVFIASCLMLLTIIFKFSYGTIFATMLRVIISPLYGIRFLIRRLGGTYTLVAIMSFIIIMMIRLVTGNDYDSEYDDEQSEEKENIE